MSKFYLGNELIIDPDVKLEKVLLTQAEYDALTEKDDNKLYIIIDAKNPLEDIQNRLDTLEGSKGIVLEDNQLIYYTTDSNQINIVDWAQGSTPGGSDWAYNPTQHIVSHEYNSDARYGIITFDTNVIPEGLFISQPTLLKVDMADNIVFIGAEAFCNCTTLKEIRLSNTLKAIGYDAFYLDSALESIYIPDSVVDMTKNPDENDTYDHGCQFMKCTSLQNIRLSKNMTIIPGVFLSECTSLTSIDFPNSVTTIKDGSIGQCRNLNNITIPKNVTTIGENAFWHCNSVKTITINSTKLTSLPNNFMARCELDIFTVPSSITTGSATWLNVATINNLIFPATFTHFTSGHNAAATLKNIDFSGDSVTNFPRLNNQLETVILRKNALVTGLDELIPSSIITTKLQIYVPTNLIESYKTTYPYLSNYFFEITGDSLATKKYVMNNIQGPVAHIMGEITDLGDRLSEITSSIGAVNGIARLNDSGKVPTEQLPSYVDDVIDVYATYAESDSGQLANIILYLDAEHTQEVTGESGKIYQNVDENQPSYQFRWTGTIFSQVGASSLILGEATGTAYDGAKGKASTDNINKVLGTTLSHISGISATTDKVSISYENFRGSQYGNTVGDRYIEDILSATEEKAGVMSAADKVKLDGIDTQLEGKVDKVTGKQLSTEDFTTVLKTKLEGLSNYNDSSITNRITQLETSFQTLLTRIQTLQ